MVDFFTQVGGWSVIDKLVDDFYHIMQNDPLATDCLKTHAGKDLIESGTKLKYFLSGWLGGPPLYLESYGSPRLRMRHFPFSIGEKESKEWLYCMNEALKKSTINEHVQSELLKALEGVTVIIKNRP